MKTGSKHYNYQMPVVEATMAGDTNCDGDIDVRDVTTLNQYLIKMIDMNDEQKANANVIKDDMVDVSDLGQLKKYIIKLISKF